MGVGWVCHSGADLIGASVAVLLIERYARMRDDEERLRQPVRECASSDHSVAIWALLELDTPLAR